jgi:hypothetical protein
MDHATKLCTFTSKFAPRHDPVQLLHSFPSYQMVNKLNVKKYLKKQERNKNFKIYYSFKNAGKTCEQ